MNGFDALEAALILVIFRMCLLISLTSGLDNGCVKESKKTSNDQEPTQSDPTSYPQNQKGNN